MKKKVSGHGLIKKIILAIAVMPLAIRSTAQEVKETLKLTLEKARVIAMEKNPEMTAAKLDASISTLAIAEARLKKRPQVYTDFNLQRNLIIPVTPVPANAFDPNAPEGKLLPLRFTTKWTSNTGINASIELFNPQKKLAVKEAEIRDKITQLETSQLANDIFFDVSTAYIAALIAAEQLRLAITDTLTNAALLKMSQQQFDEGRLLLVTLNQVKAGRNNALSLFDEAQKIYTDAIGQLLYSMGLTANDQVEIELMDNLETLVDSYRTNSAMDSLNSIALNKQIQEDALLNAQIKAAANGFLPSLTVKGYYGTNYFDNNFEVLKSSNWNGNSFVNLGVKLPITGSEQRQKTISRLKLQKQANQLRYVSKLNRNIADYAAATREAEVFEKKIVRAKENMTLAESNLRIAEQQFASGRLSIAELNRADYDYQKEKNSYLNTAYNYLSAKLSIEKSARF